MRSPGSGAGQATNAGTSNEPNRNSWRAQVAEPPQHGERADGAGEIAGEIEMNAAVEKNVDDEGASSISARIFRWASHLFPVVDPVAGATPQESAAELPAVAPDEVVIRIQGEPGRVHRGVAAWRQGNRSSRGG